DEEFTRLLDQNPASAQFYLSHSSTRDSSGQLIYDMPVSISPTLIPTSASAPNNVVLPSPASPPVVSQLGPIPTMTTAFVVSVTPVVSVVPSSTTQTIASSTPIVSQIPIATQPPMVS
ncbi:hypothetical protein KI387_039332, partial [Taxus chinensis]